MSTPRIVIESFPNDTIKYFHVNGRISSEKLYDTLPGADALAKFGMNDHAPSTIQTALSFYEIEGVTSIGLDIYEVSVTISPAFKWEEIIPQVVDVIKKQLRLEGEVELLDRDFRPAYR
jgi:hypothetical protein